MLTPEGAVSLRQLGEHTRVTVASLREVPSGSLEGPHRVRSCLPMSVESWHGPVSKMNLVQSTREGWHSGWLLSHAAAVAGFESARATGALRAFLSARRGGNPRQSGFRGGLSTGLRPRCGLAACPNPHGHGASLMSAPARRAATSTSPLRGCVHPQTRPELHACTSQMHACVLLGWFLSARHRRHYGSTSTAPRPSTPLPSIHRTQLQAQP